MAPTPSAIEPRGLSDAWFSLKNVLDWAVNIITTAYAYTDGLISWRQNSANEKYKKEKAEQEARRIEQELLEKQRQKGLNETKPISQRRQKERLVEIEGEPVEDRDDRLWAIWDSYPWDS